MTRKAQLSSVLSKAMFGIGVALAVAAVVTIYVTSIASQKQTTSSSSSQQTSGGVATSSSNQSGAGASSTTSNIQSRLTTQILISQGAATQQVKIFYEPNPASVSNGAKIIWNNKDSAPHTSTADNNSFDTGIIQPGSSGSAIIKGQATIPYHCTIHPWIKANLIVASTGGNG
jgi:plastocyanin